MTVSDDPATMVGASADSVTPRGVDCAERLTVHGAAPPPASDVASCRVTVSPRGTRPNESPVGSVKIKRVVGAGDVDAAAALARRGDLRLRVVTVDGVAGGLERRLDLLDGPRRVALLQQRRRARDVRRRHARPVPAVPAAGNRREDALPGRRHVRLHLERDRSGAAGGERRDLVGRVADVPRRRSPRERWPGCRRSRGPQPGSRSPPPRRGRRPRWPRRRAPSRRCRGWARSPARRARG